MADSGDSGEKKLGKAEQQGDGATTSSAKEADLTSKLDTIIASVANISEQNKALLARVAALEQPTSQSSADRSDDRIDSGRGPDADFSHENFEEELEIDEDCDEETGDCLDFDAGVLSDKTGKNIDDGVAGKINSGLLLPTDQAQIKTIFETYPRPENVESAQPSSEQGID